MSIAENLSLTSAKILNLLPNSPKAKPLLFYSPQK